MPRGPRVDVLDGLYHLIGRGVERRPIFRTDRDREDFLRRVAAVVEEEDLRLFAFVPRDNHFRRAVLEGNGRPVEVSRYLNIRPASITGHLRVLRELTKKLRTSVRRLNGKG
ncbi:MAG TPA: hypothetical protein VF515_20605 [Candidatus Binatia bacterium]